MELLLICKYEQCCSSWKKKWQPGMSASSWIHTETGTWKIKDIQLLLTPGPFLSSVGDVGRRATSTGYSPLRLQNHATSQSSLQLWFGPSADHNYIFYPLWTTFQATTKLFITALSVPWDLNVSLCEDSWRNDQKSPTLKTFISFKTLFSQRIILGQGLT